MQLMSFLVQRKNGLRLEGKEGAIFTLHSFADVLWCFGEHIHMIYKSKDRGLITRHANDFEILIVLVILLVVLVSR